MTGPPEVGYPMPSTPRVSPAPSFQPGHMPVTFHYCRIYADGEQVSNTDMP